MESEVNTKSDSSTIRVGGHVSISGGLAQAVQRAADIGGSCMQIFSGSPRSWQRKSLSEYQPGKMFAKQKELSVGSVFTHAVYLINLASNNEELVAKSVQSLVYDLKFDHLVKGSGVVVHLGSHQGRGWESSRDQLVGAINSVLDQTPESSQFLIENSGGQAGKIASDLEEVRWLLDQVDSERLGWCFDTCHGFGAGYALTEASDQSDLSAKQLKKGRGPVLAEIDQLQLWPSLKCIHVNDSLAEFASGNDRHANIGDGLIPQSDMKVFLNHDRVKQRPLITEVPGLDGSGPDLANVNCIKQLINRD